MRRQTGGEPLLVALIGGVAAICSLLSSPSVLAAASSTIHSHICKADFAAPAIAEPMSGYRSTLSSVTVKGTGEPNMPVTVRVGGHPKAATTIAGDGTFTAQVPLAVGSNTLVAREQDGCGNIKDSSEVTVERQQSAPSPTPESSTSSPSQSGSSAGRAGTPSFGSFPNVGDGSIGSGEKPSKETQGSVRAPTITSLQEGQTVNSDHIWVAGTGQPGSIIIIYVNGKEAGRVIVGEDGTYGVEVPLRPGQNAIKAVQEWEGKRFASRTWHVDYVPKAGKSPEMSDVRWTLWTAVLLIALFVAVVAWFAYRRHKGGSEEETL